MAVAAAHAFSDPVWSPDGQSVAYLKGNEVWVVHADGSDRRLLGQPGPGLHMLGWAPDGKSVLVGQVRVAPNHSPYAMPYESIQSATLWFVPVDGSALRQWRRGTFEGRVLCLCGDHLCVAAGPIEWSPAGAHSYPTLQLTTLEGDVVKTLEHAGASDVCALSPDLKRVAYLADMPVGKLVVRSFDQAGTLKFDAGVPLVGVSTARIVEPGHISAIWSTSDRLLIVRGQKHMQFAWYDLPTHMLGIWMPLSSMPATYLGHVAYTDGDTVVVDSHSIYEDHFHNDLNMRTDAWSPAHDRLLVTAPDNIYAIDTHSSPPICLSDGPLPTEVHAAKAALATQSVSGDYQPVWSTRGTHLAYLRIVYTWNAEELVSKAYQIHAVALDGSGDRTLADWQSVPAEPLPQILGWSLADDTVVVERQRHVWLCPQDGAAAPWPGKSSGQVLGLGGDRLAFLDDTLDVYDLAGHAVGTFTVKDGETLQGHTPFNGVSPSARFVVAPVRGAYLKIDTRNGSRRTISEESDGHFAIPSCFWGPHDEFACNQGNDVLADAHLVHAGPYNADRAVAFASHQVCWTSELDTHLWIRPMRGPAKAIASVPHKDELQTDEITIDPHSVSPDGHFIAVSRVLGHQYLPGGRADLAKIYICAPDGSGLRNL